ncbi:hypothetical protein U0534_17380 [Bacillus atrophaeus]|uniref:Uncharacterized protein n=1 Tax=Bacillus atrophaeus (strain 1942) TaxID=720555 RepID=A0ABM5LZF4_BACA1|nr:hypothetical protein [Bacillus atrophaeus]ADP33192.1 hypothetical protein BATR1942_11305 [Bacillus atrophaeus 1942]MEC0833100.1 hypothetical protein [Bacillus atrophaeus]MEC0905819.1 hypothetical protein [Bacillus atrophaeus]MEC1730552.1 hypothetical protein [Bacillus atrophaeus]MED4566140.1 hypothetical protein [Bacillus atrophaeus]
MFAQSEITRGIYPSAAGKTKPQTKEDNKASSPAGSSVWSD